MLHSSSGKSQLMNAFLDPLLPLKVWPHKGLCSLGKKENMGLKLSGDTSTSGIVTSK